MENLLPDREVYTICAAAEVLRCTDTTVYRRIYSGEIRVLAGRGRILIPRAELERYLSRVVVHTKRRAKNPSGSSKKQQVRATDSHLAKLTEEQAAHEG
jgi:excisionase family DNA binding protein